MSSVYTFVKQHCVGKSAEYAQGYYEGFMEEHSERGVFSSIVTEEERTATIRFYQWSKSEPLPQTDFARGYAAGQKELNTPADASRDDPDAEIALDALYFRTPFSVQVRP